MFEFLTDADPLLKTFWYVALPTSLIFLVLTILTFIGADNADGATSDFDSNFDGDAPLQMFSLRNLINFLLGFSWGGISLWNTIENKSLLLFVSLMIGASFFVLFLLAMRQMMKIQEDNTLKMTDALNKTGTVYLRVPSNKTAMGKIQISIKGSQREFQAITKGEELESGTAIRVIEVLDDNLCLIEKL
jgi:hypothetical protein